MVAWLAEVEPQLAELTTWNAASNAHMIEVNELLGYRVWPAASTGSCAWRPDADLKQVAAGRQLRAGRALSLSGASNGLDGCSGIVVDLR